jgi:rhamnosyltransferase
MSFSIVAGLVLYRPPQAAWELMRFLKRTGLPLWVVDNTETPEAPQEDADFWTHNGNQGGLSRALNLLCAKAAQERKDWILLLDQDSIFASQEDLLRLLAHAQNAASDIALVAPIFSGKQKGGLLPYAITSGSCLRLRAWQECGPYRTDFLLDGLDKEYGLRLWSHHWRIVQYADSFLRHQMGNQEAKRFLGRTPPQRGTRL